MRTKSFYIIGIICIVLTLCVVTTAGAGTIEGIKVYVNEELIGPQAKIIDGEVYIPLTAINQDMGGKAAWDNDSKSVHVTIPDRGVTSVINKISPSVVGVAGKPKEDKYSKYSGQNGIAFGTGIIYKADGYIITNAHVVNALKNIVVVLSNSKAYQGRVKAIDDESDLALIKIDKGGLTPATLGDTSDIVVGEHVVAIGTPLSFSLRNSATLGIIGGINRSVEGSYRFIQSDAAINAGNSGGPLVNMQGLVLGVNSVKYQGIGVEGLNFSIPVDTLKYVLEHFEKYGKVKRPYLGATFSEGLAAMQGLPSDEGLTITEILKDSPAEKAGLKVDDVLTSVNNIKITTVVAYNEEMKKYLPGNTVEVKVTRETSDIKLNITYNEKK